MRQNTQNGTDITISIFKLTKEHMTMQICNITIRIYNIIRIHNLPN
jgi:hypothetical protein